VRKHGEIGQPTEYSKRKGGSDDGCGTSPSAGRRGHGSVLGKLVGGGASDCDGGRPRALARGGMHHLGGKGG